VFPNVNEERDAATLSLRKVWRDIQRLLQSWWRVDRVRVSPREGALLRLDVGDSIVVGQCAALIASRHITATSSGAVVVYNCSSVEGESVLEVPITVRRPSGTIVWRTGDNGVVIHPDEIELYSSVG
jgi:hypothetical protein